LIPLYRGIETTALGGTGLVVSGVVAALAALEAAEAPQRAAEGVLLSVGAWAPILMLLIEIMALTRLRRASAYIAYHLRPLAESLSGRAEILMWEVAPTSELLKTVAAERHALPAGAAVGRRRLLARGGKAVLSEGVVRISASSAPLIGTIALVSIALACGGAIVHPTALTIASGVLAVALAMAGAAYGIAFSYAHERRASPEVHQRPGSPDQPEATR
jgi:hypothetical protein